MAGISGCARWRARSSTATNASRGKSQRMVGDLLNAEINDKQARSIKYQFTIAWPRLTAIIWVTTKI